MEEKLISIDNCDRKREDYSADKFLTGEQLVYAESSTIKNEDKFDIDSLPTVLINTEWSSLKVDENLRTKFTMLKIMNG